MSTLTIRSIKLLIPLLTTHTFLRHHSNQIYNITPMSMIQPLPFKSALLRFIGHLLIQTKDFETLPVLIKAASHVDYKGETSSSVQGMYNAA